MAPRMLGVFCGTFNPIHCGHLLMAQCACDQLNMEKMLFITSPNPPHRHRDILDAEQRYQLVEAAIADNPKFQASRIELDRSGPSYTVDTLRVLKQKFPEHQLNLLVGEDNLSYIGKWHEADEIFKLCHLVVAPRVKQVSIETQSPSALSPDIKMTMLDVPHIPVSSSEIRRRLRADQSVLDMVPAAVNKMLVDRRLFRE